MNRWKWSALLGFCLLPCAAFADIESARTLQDGTVQIVEDGQAILVPADPASRYRRKLEEWVNAGHTIAPYVPSVAELAGRIRTEAGRRIAGVYNRTTKDQMLARANELLLNRITNGSFTPEEEAELNALMAANAWVKSVRQAAESAIATLPGLTENQRMAFDVETDVAWPAGP